MNSDPLASLVTRYWEAESASRSPRRDERVRVMSWGGDLYRIDEEVEAVMRQPEWADQFLLAALNHPERPEDDWVVAWLGSTLEDAIRGGDTQLLERLVQQGMNVDLAERIRLFID
ncbi:hypothetical protein ACFQRL_00050 [Microbacterium fluvii]|uniref:Uncharacterized protein n=1 Tax=Microbacterium fluvii TaxID=415215 RepID=A0ABW2H937_9MICO|nr:hypothetical protein [Microbacterium fluvii]MCU4670976.1 hypothetical protein [Microbacterium fluvii]